MVFSSAIFLLKFLPIIYISNYFAKEKYSNILLCIGSLVFYAWGEPQYVFLMIISIVINWGIGIALEIFPRNKKFVLILGIILDLGILGYYKYVNFLIDILNKIFSRELFPIQNISLPIGISFFTFQAISYIIDIYREETEASKKIINVALYISFFPQLIAGPIVKYKDINEQIEKRTISSVRLALGFKKFIYGLSKKVLISNVLGMCADTIYTYDISLLGGGLVWIGALAYTFQIYYDFSGYSDMAIGLGQMFGFDIPENFNYPYLSKSISEFWRRWHISLGSWFREYVYIPLGGNRLGIVRTYINLLIVFLLTGLWHGANFSFILWGLYHGFFSIIERLGLKKILDKSLVISRIYCFSIVNFGWVLFRADGIIKGLKYIARMVVPWKYTDSIQIMQVIDYKTIFIWICAICGSGIISKCVPCSIIEKWNDSVLEALICVVLLILCLASIASDTYNPFIYFQF